MRAISLAVLLGGSAMIVGCQRGADREDVQAQREDLLEERKDLAQTRAEAMQERQQEVQEARQSAQEEVADARQDVVEQRQELQETRSEFHQQQAQQQQQQDESGAQAIGGGANEGFEGPTLTGTVQSKMADKLTLQTGQGTRELIITTDTEFTRNGEDIEMNQIAAGSEVRASYKTELDKQVAEKVEVLDRGTAQ